MKIDLLKVEMEKRKINAATLAEMSGLSRSTISRILNGQRGCTVAIAKQISESLHLKPKQAMEIFFEE